MRMCSSCGPGDAPLPTDTLTTNTLHGCLRNAPGRTLRTRLTSGDRPRWRALRRPGTPRTATEAAACRPTAELALVPASGEPLQASVGNSLRSDTGPQPSRTIAARAAASVGPSPLEALAATNRPQAEASDDSANPFVDHRCELNHHRATRAIRIRRWRTISDDSKGAAAPRERARSSSGREAPASSPPDATNLLPMRDRCRAPRAADVSSPGCCLTQHLSAERFIAPSSGDARTRTQQEARPHARRSTLINHRSWARHRRVTPPG